MRDWNRQAVVVGTTELTVLTLGSGSPLVVLHDEMGVPPVQQWHRDLATRYRLIMPVIPGFVGPRLDWVRGISDLAPLVGTALTNFIGGPFDVVGLTLGGWLAAEMAISAPPRFRRLTLVSPFGLKPSIGIIADMFLMTSADYVRAAFANPDAAPEFKPLYAEATPETIEGWEDARIECARLAWEPYMHRPSMPQLLPCVGNLPVQVIWGDRDVIVPESAAKAYAQGFPSGRLEIIPGCGHRPEIEARERFVALIEAFHPPLSAAA